MKPYFDNGLVRIFHGDCLDGLGRLEDPEFAAVVVDPPYASGARTEARKASSGAMVRGGRWADKPIENDQMTTTGFLWFVRELCYAVRPRLVDGGAFLSFIDWRQWPNLVGAIESTNLRVNQMVVWDKETYGTGNGYRNQHELICYGSKGVPRVVDRSVSNVLRYRRDRSADHPSPKPVGLMRDLLRVVARPGELVIDPCAGAGATLEAAASMGVRAVGFDVVERHCESAARRVEAVQMFSEEAF